MSVYLRSDKCPVPRSCLVNDDMAKVPVVQLDAAHRLREDIADDDIKKEANQLSPVPKGAGKLPEPG
jgi:hypothetical protein